MLPLLAALAGALLGWAIAARRGGARLDRLQYAAVLAILFGLVGLFVAVFAVRGIG